MEFVLGLYVGIAAGFYLRGIVHKIDFKVNGMANGSKTKNHR